LVEVPSFFSKPDFLGALLPGYVTIILLVFLFFPALAPTQENKGISIDFFSAIIFIVAGPTVGYTLRQMHRVGFRLISRAGAELKKKAAEQYYAARIAMSDSEKLELDMSEAQYDFNVSTGIMLILIGLYTVFTEGLSIQWKSLPLICVGIFMLLGAYVEWKDGFMPLYTKLVLKYRAE
jgi:hypothetical protein